MRKKDKRADKNAKETVSGSLRSQDDFEREEASFYPPDSPEYEDVWTRMRHTHHAELLQLGQNHPF